MKNLSDGEKLIITNLAGAISKKLTSQKIKLFTAEPTVYVTLGDERLYISLADEEEQKIDVRLSTKKEISVFGFFFSRFMFKDFAYSIDDFSSEKVKDYLEEEREINAFSRNLRRADSLVKDEHYFAALIMLVSAFEVASRDIFFRNNSYWFIQLDYILNEERLELLEKFGVNLTNKEESADYQQYRIKVNVGDTYGFTDSSYDKLKKWESVLFKDWILGICRQLGIIEEYSQKLSGNSFQEIGYYEILLNVLQKSKRKTINFQMLEGIGGMKWSFKRFFNIDLENIQNEMRILKECFQKRHQVIHGQLDDTAITEDQVLELKTAVRKVISYIRNEIMDLKWIFD